MFKIVDKPIIGSKVICNYGSRYFSGKVSAICEDGRYIIDDYNRAWLVDPKIVSVVVLNEQEKNAINPKRYSRE